MKNEELLLEKIIQCNDTIEVSDLVQIVVSMTKQYRELPEILAISLSIMTTAYVNSAKTGTEKEARAELVTETFGEAINVVEPNFKEKDILN